MEKGDIIFVNFDDDYILGVYSGLRSGRNDVLNFLALSTFINETNKFENLRLMSEIAFFYELVPFAKINKMNIENNGRIFHGYMTLLLNNEEGDSY